jgi:hypothetical protein
LTLYRGVVLAAFVAGLSAGLGPGCSRDANIYDTPEQQVTPGPDPPPPDGGIPRLPDAGLEGELACAERPQGPCGGTADFPCGFHQWVSSVAEQCRELSNCPPNDWLSVRMTDGCVTSVGMVRPEAEFVACIVKEFVAYQCPCESLEVSYYLGLGGEGCSDGGLQPCGGGEFPCPPGFHCESGVCVPNEAGYR